MQNVKTEFFSPQAQWCRFRFIWTWHCKFAKISPFQCARKPVKNGADAGGNFAKTEATFRRVADVDFHLRHLPQGIIFPNLVQIRKIWGCARVEKICCGQIIRPFLSTMQTR